MEKRIPVQPALDSDLMQVLTELTMCVLNPRGQLLTSSLALFIHPEVLPPSVLVTLQYSSHNILTYKSAAGSGL